MAVATSANAGRCVNRANAKAWSDNLAISKELCHVVLGYVNVQPSDHQPSVRHVEQRKKLTVYLHLPSYSEPITRARLEVSWSLWFSAFEKIS